MQNVEDIKSFQDEWFDFAKIVVGQIAKDPAIVAMRADFEKSGTVSFEQRSQFIATANRIKMEVIHERYGAEGSKTFQEFIKRWRTWYDGKGVVSAGQGNRRLTNEEHIVYSSTPEAEEFFRNIK